MTVKKWIGSGILFLLVAAAIADAIRYLQPDKKQKTIIQLAPSMPRGEVSEIIMVYNANGGIYPGIADVIHKTLFPKTYPCRLCYLAFGHFGKKEAWQNFLDSIPYKKTALHKDDFRRNYGPKDFPLPAILVSNGNETRVLVQASEINQQHTLSGLIQLVQRKL